MRKSAAALAAIGLLTALTAAAPAPAEAHDWGRGWRGEEWREHHNSGAAIALGIVGGILTGAAIAAAQAHPPPAYYYPPQAAYPYYGAPYAGYGY